MKLQDGLALTVTAAWVSRGRCVCQLPHCMLLVSARPGPAIGQEALGAPAHLLGFFGSGSLFEAPQIGWATLERINW